MPAVNDWTGGLPSEPANVRATGQAQAFGPTAGRRSALVHIAQQPDRVGNIHRFVTIGIENRYIARVIEAPVPTGRQLGSAPEEMQQESHRIREVDPGILVGIAGKLAAPGFEL